MTPDGITLPYGVFFTLLFVCGIFTFFCGIYLGYILRLAIVFIRAFLAGK